MRDSLTAAASCLQFESSPAARDATVVLPDIARHVLGRQPAPEPHTAGRARIPREEVIRRCHELLERRDSWPRVAEMAAAAKVSQRTLRTVFQEYFGVAPLRYLHLRQLHQVRRALQAAEPGAASVSQILVENGVWDFSRFASRYRRQFGELPSATLRAGSEVSRPV